MPTKSEDEEFISNLFIELDRDKDGRLNSNELKLLLQRAGHTSTKENVDKLLSLGDVNQNSISFEEFKRICIAAKSDDLHKILQFWLSNKHQESSSVWKVLTAGGVAGAVSRTCTSPLERIKILFQISSMEGPKLGKEGIHYSRSVFGSLREMFQKEGFRGFFKGNGTNVLRIAPYSAVQFLSFEKYKAFLVENRRIINMKSMTLESLVAGGGAGITALVTTYPLDLIRTRLTIQTTEGKYNGIVDTFQKVVREEGYRGLYKGVVTSSLGIAPYVAINFSCYDWLKRHFVKNRTISVTESLTYGGIAGAVAQTVTYPIDLLRRRMQLQGAGGSQKLYTGTFDCARHIVKAEGFIGLYRGMVACYLKVVPAIAISFGTYELMRRVLAIEERKLNFGAG